MTRPNVAIVSPSRNLVSETFVKAHVDALDGEIFHYFNGHLPKELHGHGPLLKHDILTRIGRKIRAKSELSIDEQAVMESFQNNSIQVVLAEYGPTGAQLTRICSTLDIPLVVHFHGYDASQYDILEKYASAYSQMFKQAAAIIVVSEKMKEMIIDIGMDEERIQLLPYGPAPGFSSIERKLSSKAHFLSVGRFVDKKAPYYVLLAFKSVIDSGQEAHLTMAGTGPLFACIKNMVKYFGLENRVSLPGIVDHEQVMSLMADASCYVQHSIRAESGDMEGTPVSVLEAAAAGLQVISTRHAGIPDVILHGETGLLVEEHDVAGMAAHLLRSASHPEEALAMGLKSRERVKAYFTRERNISELNRVITEAIGSR
jgi:glycosyltransferase involved in cell wall biosynthesis